MLTFWKNKLACTAITRSRQQLGALTFTVVALVADGTGAGAVVEAGAAVLTRSISGDVAHLDVAGGTPVRVLPALRARDRVRICKQEGNKCIHGCIHRAMFAVKM